MHPRESWTQPGSSSQDPIIIDDDTDGGDDQRKQGIPPTTSPEQSSKQPAQASRHHGAVDTLYKIVWADRQEYSMKGYGYSTYIGPPERNRTGWFCFVAFYWHDVAAEFECVYCPSIKLFDDFKPIGGTLRGGRRGSQGV